MKTWIAPLLLMAGLAGCGDISVAAPGDDAGDVGPGRGGSGGGAGAGAPGVAGASQGGSSGSAGTGNPAGGSAGHPSAGGGAEAGGAGGTSEPPACPPSSSPCPAGTTCVLQATGQGLCECPGYPDVAYCGAGCAELKTDPANCGSCRHACGQGQSCQAGQCR